MAKIPIRHATKTPPTVSGSVRAGDMDFGRVERMQAQAFKGVASMASSLTNLIKSNIKEADTSVEESEKKKEFDLSVVDAQSAANEAKTIEELDSVWGAFDKKSVEIRSDNPKVQKALDKYRNSRADTVARTRVAQRLNFQRRDIKSRSDALYQGFIENGQKDLALEQLDIQFNNNIIPKGEYDKRKSEIDGEIGLTRAGMFFNTNEPQKTIEELEKLPNKSLTADQLKQKHDLNLKAKTQQKQNNNQGLNDMLSWMERNRELNVVERESKRTEFINILDDANVDGDNFGANMKRFNLWVNGQDSTTNQAVFKTLMDRVTSIHTGSTRKVVDAINDSITKNESKLSTNDLEKLNNVKRNVIDKQFVDTLKTYNDRFVSDKIAKDDRVQFQMDSRSFIEEYIGKHGIKPSPSEFYKYTRERFGELRTEDERAEEKLIEEGKKEQAKFDKRIEALNLQIDTALGKQREIVDIKTAAEARKLPVGTKFRTPDGRIMER
jgi:hypothetical protein